jgi:ATP-binding protein involved in chromosome partitioning
LLGQIPLESKLREGGDVGEPIVVTDPTSDVALAFTALAKTVAAQGPARVYRQELKLL